MFYGFFPLYLAARFHPAPGLIPGYFALCAALCAYLVNKYARRTNRMKFSNQDLQEKINILKDENVKERKNKIALQSKIGRYNGLKKIIEEINRNLSLDFIAEYLIAVAFSIIAQNRGVSILYLFDSESQKLSLFKAKKEDKKLIIKTKEGDIFDFWVLRHLHPLLVEDTKSDFRFDLEKIKTEKERPVSSLVIAPFLSDHRFVGSLRLDSADADSFTQDDLRFLVTICDLGALALENAQLYLKTQDLAIHDGLTNFYRKGYFMERLREECKRSSRQGKTFSLLMLDIDHFKDFNDTFGHTAGDIILREISLAITGELKDKSAIISRFGGEEFCIALSGTEMKEAVAVAEKLRKKCEGVRVMLRQEKVSVTVSIGVANFPQHDTDEIELILKADKAMYEAKQKGRNRVAAARI